VPIGNETVMASILPSDSPPVFLVSVDAVLIIDFNLAALSPKKTENKNEMGACPGVRCWPMISQASNLNYSDVQVKTATTVTKNATNLQVPALDHVDELQSFSLQGC
jgi:hypothetical protein